MARILIVDDEEYTRDLIQEVLLPQGHELMLAAGGVEALGVLRTKSIDLVVVDRNMPGMSGIELVGIIRLNAKLKGIKILMCTASSVTKEVEEAFQAGADDYALKPLNFPSLVGKIAKLLATPSK